MKKLEKISSKIAENSIFLKNFPNTDLIREPHALITSFKVRHSQFTFPTECRSINLQLVIPPKRLVCGFQNCFPDSSGHTPQGRSSWCFSEHCSQILENGREMSGKRPKWGDSLMRKQVLALSAHDLRFALGSICVKVD